ncbi:MAG: DUF2313 domain-containing protein [Alphaproteobacteria bacterium]|nr:DUF2313 domain-containing protein [Alphaproteobacteria bacterium]
MNTDAYLAQLQQLLPSGAAWPRDDDAVLTQLLRAMAARLAAAHGRTGDLADELDPRTARELLADWERVLGLPDACSATTDTVGERQAMCHAKLTATGGQSAGYFIDLAQRLGYAVTITEYRPFRAGASRAGDPCCSADWRFVWDVNAPATTVRPFRAGEGSAGEPLRSWGNEILECAIGQTKPAHTNVNFTYGG